MGIQAVSVPIVFPVLYEPFFGSQAAYQPYLTFYSQVAQAVRAAGLKLIVDNEVLYSNDIAAGWTNMNAFYSTLTWPQYVTARAQMDATIAHGQLTKLATVKTTTYKAVSFNASTTYYFEIVAVDTSFNDSAPSGQISATTVPLPPAPTNLMATTVYENSQPSSQITVTTPPMSAAPVNVVATANSSTRVTVTWTETIPPDGLPIQNYTIFRGTSPSALSQLTIRAASPLIDTSVSSATTYYYAIEATDTGRDVSPKSSPAAEVTTPD